MLPEFRQARNAINAAVRRVDRAVEKVRNYGYAVPKKSRRSKRASEVQGRVPQSGLGGGEDGTGTSETANP